MEHTQIVTASELEDYADRRGSEAVIPELVWLLVNESVSDLPTCRIPYGDTVNQPGWDGLVEAGVAFRQYVPLGKSFWEIGTGGKPQTKATDDFKKRTRSMPLRDRETSAYVFVTPRGAGAGGWTEPAQTKWKQRRQQFGWNRIVVLDGQQLADWLREFPALGKWLLRMTGAVKTATGFSTPAEHWENLQQIAEAGDPPLPHEVFLAGRDRAAQELRRLFDGETSQLLLATESEGDAEDFVAAFLESLDEDARRMFSNRCLFVRDADAWLSFANLRTSHVLVASPKLNLESEDQLYAAAKRRGHGIVIPVSGTWAHGRESLIQLRSPSANTLESTLRTAGFEPTRARQLGSAGALSLAALKRSIRGLGELPPYATWENARVIAQVQLAGGWDGNNQADREALENLVGNSYGEWVEAARAESLRADTPLTQRDEKWRAILRAEAWSALGPRITNDDLDRLCAVALTVLGELDPKFDMPKDERFVANIHGKVLTYSERLRDGLSTSLALMGSRPAALTSCTRGKAESLAASVVRELLRNAGWKKWASLNSHLPMLAEAAPDEFLSAIEAALSEPATSAFLDLYAQEGNGVGGWNYMTGVLWALETLAWHPDYLVRTTTILGDLAAIDPGGNWANRPANSLNTIFLPWLPQTVAPIPRRKAAIEALNREQPAVCWNVLLGLLPTSYGSSSGTRRPAWRNYIPQDWNEQVTHQEYWNQVSAYGAMASDIASSDISKLAELIDRLPDLPAPAAEKILEHLGSESVRELPESDRTAIWEALTDVANKHRRFADAQWAMPPDMVERVEAAAALIEPVSHMFANRRLFSDRDFDLYGETGDFSEQQKNLNATRERVIRQMLDEHGLPGVFDFLHEVQSPRKVGLALGGLDSPGVDEALLPDFLGREDRESANFADSFVHGRFWTKSWSWIDAQLSKPWTIEQRLSFLKLLPFEPQTWLRVSTSLADQAGRYWAEVPVNPWILDAESLVEAVEHLLSHERPFAAITCISMLVHKKTDFPVELAVRALTGPSKSNHARDPFDQNHTLEVIQWVQERLPVDSEELFRIEWFYLRLLERHHGGEPKALEWRLSSDPTFFCQVIALVYRSDKEEVAPEGSEADKSMAENAYRLLRAWRTAPGSHGPEAFDGGQFLAWLDAVKRGAGESGRLRVAMIQLGQTLAYCPPDPDGLWIHRSIATALDGKSHEDIRSGFITGVFNKRGVFGFTSGAAEREIARGYREKADALSDEGFHRIADSVRKIAERYEQDAERDAASNPFDD